MTCVERVGIMREKSRKKTSFLLILASRSHRAGRWDFFPSNALKSFFSTFETLAQLKSLSRSTIRR